MTERVQYFLKRPKKQIIFQPGAIFVAIHSRGIVQSGSATFPMHPFWLASVTWNRPEPGLRMQEYSFDSFLKQLNTTDALRRTCPESADAPQSDSSQPTPFEQKVHTGLLALFSFATI